ncbi:hypothetical protein OSTOST_15921 [Ostertagia ostertagi]
MIRNLMHRLRMKKPYGQHRAVLYRLRTPQHFQCKNGHRHPIIRQQASTFALKWRKYQRHRLANFTKISILILPLLSHNSRLYMCLKFMLNCINCCLI